MHEPERVRTTSVAVDDLRVHPKNYRAHPPDQIEHLAQSIREHGLYRPIVVARDNTVLAGHGVLEAIKRLGLAAVDVVVLDLDPNEPRALKVLTGDNEISHLAEIDDRALSELLREIRDVDPTGLFGTGYDDAMLANLVFVTRPESEIRDLDAAAHWVGMPEYDAGSNPLKLTVSFKTREDRAAFARALGVALTDDTRGFWWPVRSEQDDVASVRFVSDQHMSDQHMSEAAS